MATIEEPILSRIHRLDYMLRQLEEIRGCNRSPKRSCASTLTSESDGHVSSVNFSLKSLEKHCRPIENVMMETEVKGTMIERLNQVEDRMLKLEEEWVAKRKKEEEKKMNKSPKKGFKQLVKQCVKARRKHDNKEA